ncbi:MAG: sulfurtransferase [Burkholderiales bacterium]|nr:sulfurtransferase [Burkholderiales bacterium]
MKHSPEFLALADAARKRIKEASPEEVKQLAAKGAVVIDVRDAHEFAAGHIEGAINVSRGTLEMRISEIVPDKDASVVCYCSGGNRGALATDTLQQMGYKNAVSICGGLNAFQGKDKKS